MKTVVVDYGIGNVFSVCNAIRQIGREVNLTGEPSAILEADRVILPGVGAFARCMDALRARGLVAPLGEYVGSGKPFLGICVGMQMLMDHSEEFGQHPGLGFIPGRVERIASEGPDGRHLRVPHIGWASLEAGNYAQWTGTPLIEAGVDVNAVYFVHSYHCVPEDRQHRIAFANYGGLEITAAVRRDNILGFQFHPERSGVVGQRLLKSFLAP